MSTVAQIFENTDAKFGTSGLRGLVTALTDEVVGAVTIGFLDYVNSTYGVLPDLKIALAHDLRPSSPELARVVGSVFSSFGYDVWFAGAVPTPALALAALNENIPAVMITGSHIPFDRNGLKFFTPNGEITKVAELAIVSSNRDVLVDSIGYELPSPDEQIANDYLSRYQACFSGVLEGKRIGVFQHSAVGRDLSVQLFESLGAQVVMLERSEEFVPVDTEAVSKPDQEKCKRWTAEHDLDALFSTDGDGDRPLLACDSGIYFRGDVLGIMAAKFLAADYVVTPVSSNTVLEKSNWFEKTSRTKIGSPYVLEDMANAEDKCQRVVGFEANGGFLTQTDIKIGDENLTALPTRDAYLPALATISLAKEKGLSLSQLGDLLPARFTMSGRLENQPVSRSKNFLTHLNTKPNAHLALINNGMEIVALDQTDGYRMTMCNDDVVHLRPSGNAPEFRIYVETSEQSRSDKLLSFTLDKLASEIQNFK